MRSPLQRSLRSRSQMGMTVTSVAASITRRISGWNSPKAATKASRGSGSDGSVALPRCGRDAAHQVDLVAPCRHEVGEQVAVGAPPLRAVAHGGTVQARDREDGTMSDAPGEAWRLRAEQALTHLRRDAVGADDDVDLVPRAVGEDELQGVALAIEAREAMVEGDRAGRERRLEHAMQVAAMDVDVGGAEACLAGGIERELVQRGAGIGGAAHEGVRPDAHVEQPAL